jgi:hypothetical protein
MSPTTIDYKEKNKRLQNIHILTMAGMFTAMVASNFIGEKTADLPEVICTNLPQQAQAVAAPAPALKR